MWEMLGALAALTGGGLYYRRFLKSQFWTDEIRQNHVGPMLERTLKDAARIPFYHQRFGNRVPMTLQDVPVLTRADIPLLNQDVRRLYPGRRFQAGRSSGSTGRPVEVLFDLSHQAHRFAARARYLRAHGWTPARRSVWIISLPRGSADARVIRVFRSLGVAFLSVFTPLQEQLDWLRSYRPVYLYTYPSNLGGLLDLMDDDDTNGIGLKGLFCGGELLDETTRRRAMEKLRLRIADNYGTTEAFLAWQCPAGSYHVNSEHVYLEVVREDGGPARPGELGRVLITTLNNHVMPLVRYEIGDYAQATDQACGCGRTLPTLGKIVGRSIDLFRLPSGQLISPWNLVVRIKFLPQLQQFQIVQKSLDRCVLRYVSNNGLTPEDRTSITCKFAEVLGQGVRIDFEPTDKIRRSASGKFMTAFSEVNQQTQSEQPLLPARTE
ncbi:MAG: phenylacetate--CoA ligase family protein [Acidobacteriota bacterium]